MGDSNVENACQMTDRESEHSYSSQHLGYHNPSVSLANCGYHHLGVIQFYHQPCYALSAAAPYCCHNAACHYAYILVPIAPLNNGSSNHFQLAYPPRPSQLIAEEVYWSHQHEAAEEYEVYHGEESDYESDSDSDLHGDMRMDIEDMSYEQLLALEEHMGDVNTGFSEDSILKNLKTSVCDPLALTLSPLSSVSMLNERCTICLVEYEEDERIGTLDCGHRYHADCIKEWLLINNLCPICRTFAFASGGDD